MSVNFTGYPFTAVVGQDTVKRAILIVLVNQKAGGLLISGATGTAKSVLVRAATELSGQRRIFTLPLNVTEDMLFGSIDMEYAVSKGKRRFEPGLLAGPMNILFILMKRTCFVRNCLPPCWISTWQGRIGWSGMGFPLPIKQNIP